MSGGVDSSVAAALLQRAGYEVVGVFMRLGSPGESFDELQPYDSASVACDPAKIKIGHQGCCSINDAADAREVAAMLGIPLYVVNFKKDFGRIIDYFVEEYAQGRTPNPCVRCNDWLKFGKLHDYAKQIGADFVASGHYARVLTPETRRMVDALANTGIHPEDHITHTDALELLRGIDHGKDQSYVLFGAPRERLAEMLLPVGHFTKPTIRRIAEELGLPVFDKPDSQEICFVPDNDYAGLVERRKPDLRKPGTIRDAEGNTVGIHKGQHRFTIGQRRGVGVAFGYPIYVVDKNPADNSITIGERDQLAVLGCEVAEANWITHHADTPGPTGESSWHRCIARYRSHGDDVPARVRQLPSDRSTQSPSGRTGQFEIAFDEPQFGVAPGQAIVVYDFESPDRVLGGGWIRATRRAPNQSAQAATGPARISENHSVSSGFSSIPPIRR